VPSLKAPFNDETSWFEKINHGPALAWTPMKVKRNGYCANLGQSKEKLKIFGTVTA
jgi:hypothetical protein